MGLGCHPHLQFSSYQSILPHCTQPTQDFLSQGNGTVIPSMGTSGLAVLSAWNPLFLEGLRLNGSFSSFRFQLNGTCSERLLFINPFIRSPSLLYSIIPPGYYLDSNDHYMKFFIHFFTCPFSFPFFLRLHPQHMEVPRLGGELELKLLACTTVTAMWYPSHV